MSYQHYDPAIPNVNETAELIWDSVRANMDALLHQIMTNGIVENWNAGPVVGGGTPQQPDSYVHTYLADTQKRIKLDYTWGVTGPEKDSVTQMIISYTSDGGSIYDVIRTASFSYSELGAPPVVSWT